MSPACGMSFRLDKRRVIAATPTVCVKDCLSSRLNRRTLGKQVQLVNEARTLRRISMGRAIFERARLGSVFLRVSRPAKKTKTVRRCFHRRQPSPSPWPCSRAERFLPAASVRRILQRLGGAQQRLNWRFDAKLYFGRRDSFSADESTTTSAGHVQEDQRTFQLFERRNGGRRRQIRSHRYAQASSRESDESKTK